jgi:hypothetical protein
VTPIYVKISAPPSYSLDYRLSATAGVDFEALREKYKNKANISPATSLTDEEIEKIRRDTEELAGLDTLHACHVCNGTGVEVYEYNHRRCEKTCCTCDGERLVRKTRHQLAAQHEDSLPLSVLRPGSSESTADGKHVEDIVTLRGVDVDDIPPPPM